MEIKKKKEIKKILMELNNPSEENYKVLFYIFCSVVKILGAGNINKMIEVINQAAEEDREKIIN